MVNRRAHDQFDYINLTLNTIIHPNNTLTIFSNSITLPSCPFHLELTFSAPSMNCV